MSERFASPAAMPASSALRMKLSLLAMAHPPFVGGNRRRLRDAAQRQLLLARVLPHQRTVADKKESCRACCLGNLCLDSIRDNNAVAIRGNLQDQRDLAGLLT